MPVSYLGERESHLYSYLPAITARDDLWEFWDVMRERARSVPLDPILTHRTYPNRNLDVQDVTFCGYDETRIHALFVHPRAEESRSPTPCLISFHGFNGGRGDVSDFAPWLLLGVAVLSVDVREQRGETGNAALYTSGSATSVATKGLLSRDEYYYGAVYMDALKAVDLALTLPGVDPKRLILHGISQGGGIVSALSALDDRHAASLVDVPSNSNIERRMEMKVAAYSGTGAFGGVNEYLRAHPEHVERVFETLSYFDTMNMAERITAPTIAAVGLDDIVCPPECYFATYNRIRGEKQMTIYPFCGHGDVSRLQRERQIAFVAERYVNGRES